MTHEERSINARLNGIIRVAEFIDLSGEGLNKIEILALIQMIDNRILLSRPRILRLQEMLSLFEGGTKDLLRLRNKASELIQAPGPKAKKNKVFTFSPRMTDKKFS